MAMALRLNDLSLPVWLLLAGLLLCGKPLAVAAAGGSIDRVTIITAQTRHQFQVELAATAEARSRGLMQRRTLANDAGMLFIFVARSGKINGIIFGSISG